MKIGIFAKTFQRPMIEELFQAIAENVANSASRARKLLDELRNPRLRIVIDPANLISSERNQKEVLDEALESLKSKTGCR